MSDSTVSVSPSDLKRFWSHVNKDGPVPSHRPELGPCWLWVSGTNVHKYPRLRILGVNTYAHRASWTIHFSHPGDMFVCHKCDNTKCVRPDHLFLGTREENNLDMLQKGRNPKGEKHGNAIFTNQQVVEIRTRVANGESRTRVARDFHTSYNRVMAICDRKVYESAGGPICPPGHHALRTRCWYGHPLDGLNNRQRFCTICKKASRLPKGSAERIRLIGQTFA